MSFAKQPLGRKKESPHQRKSNELAGNHRTSISGQHRQLLESELQNLVHKLDEETRREAINAYNRVRVDSDFSIHLFHDSKEAEINGSRLGLRIASALKAFGLVKHRIWVELNDNECQPG